MTETCADDAPNVITDVATMPATSGDRQALAGIHLLPVTEDSDEGGADGADVGMYEGPAAGVAAGP